MNEKIIALIKREFGRHFFNQIQMVNSYEELPKEFRRDGIFVRPAWDFHSKKGQFFLINIPPNKYLTFLPKGKNNLFDGVGPLDVIDTTGYGVEPFEVENQLKLNYLDLKLKDLLKYIVTEKTNDSRKITESDILRLVKKIIK